MDNQQIREVLESLMKERKEQPLKNYVSQEKIDKLISAYYKSQTSKEKKN